jgi:hypothetical protein
MPWISGAQGLLWALRWLSPKVGVLPLWLVSLPAALAGVWLVSGVLVVLMITADPRNPHAPR